MRIPNGLKNALFIVKNISAQQLNNTDTLERIEAKLDNLTDVVGFNLISR